MPAAGAEKQPFYEWGWEGGSKRQRRISMAGVRARGEAGQVVCCVWVGETRLRGACGGAGYVCVRKWLEAEEELGVGPHTYTLASSQALCVCVFFLPLLRRCGVWNKGPIWALLKLEAAKWAGSVLRMSGALRHFVSFREQIRIALLSVRCESFADTFFLCCYVVKSIPLTCRLLSQHILITLPFLLTFIFHWNRQYMHICFWICIYFHIFLYISLSCDSMDLHCSVQWFLL